MCDEDLVRPHRPSSSDRRTLRTIRFQGDLNVGGNLTVGGSSVFNHENAQQGRALCSTGGLLPHTSDKTKTQVDIRGKVTAKNMQVDIQNSINVSYCDSDGGTSNREGVEFYRRVLRDGEDPLDFATELRVLAVQYAIPEKDLLDQFVHGLRDEGMKRKLREKRNLTIDRAIGLVEAWLDDM